MYPRIVIAGTQSGVGKTTIAVGLMAALTARGYDIQPYKVGPDYIDPGFHTLVSNNNSYNLDSYFLGEEGLREIFIHALEKANNQDVYSRLAAPKMHEEEKVSADERISIIEGVMGLFDGKGRKGESSTAHIAKTLKSPVILVIDAASMAQSGAALAYGYKNFDSELDVRGVILNNVASKGHYQMLKVPIEEDVGLEVLGYLPRKKDLKLPERHLGLVPTSESKELKSYTARLISLMEKYIDLDKFIKLSQQAPALKLKKNNNKIFADSKDFNVRLGIAYDEAFNFYYQANLDLLRDKGAELVFFSPVRDQEIPEVDGVYIGGGFPESFLAQLAKNESMKKSFYNKIQSDLPVYAECGGLMYLTREITDFNNKKYPMVGIIPGRTLMTESLQAMGYVEAEIIKDNLLFEKDEMVHGHEFHYSVLADMEEKEPVYKLSGGKGKDNRLEGFKYKNLLASYVHLHFANKPRVAQRFLNKCRNYTV